MATGVEDPARLGALELVRETLSTTGDLAEKQLALLRAEVKQLLAEERRRLVLLVIGIASAIVGLAVLLVAAALGLARVIGHAPHLTLALGLLFALAGGATLTAALRDRDKTLHRTRRIVGEEISWAKTKLEETTSSPSPAR